MITNNFTETGNFLIGDTIFILNSARMAKKRLIANVSQSFLQAVCVYILSTMHI